MIKELCEESIAEVGGGDEGGPGYNFWDYWKNLISDYQNPEEVGPG